MQVLCPICRHSQRPHIDQALIAGRELRALSDEFGASQPLLRHHRDHHVSGMARSRRRGGQQGEAYGSW